MVPARPRSNCNRDGSGQPRLRAMSDKTKVFISWSGEYTKRVAIILKRWLDEMFDQVETFVSDRDIEAGQRSLAIIEGQLANASVGLVLTTQSNQQSQWLNFEAGALSKEVSDSQARVVPILLGDLTSPAQLTGPIAQFQAKRWDRESMLDLVVSLGRLVDVTEEVVRRRFERSWEEVAGDVSAVDDRSTPLPKRSVDEMAEESLTLVRRIAGKVDGAFARSQHDFAETQLTRLLVDKGTPSVVAVNRNVDADGELRLEIELSQDAADLPTGERAYIDRVAGSVANATGVGVVLVGPWRPVLDLDLDDDEVNPVDG